LAKIILLTDADLQEKGEKYRKIRGSLNVSGILESKLIHLCFWKMEPCFKNRFIKKEKIYQKRKYLRIRHLTNCTVLLF
jgi:hypothetical protein